jgi:hypothetical protein
VLLKVRKGLPVRRKFFEISATLLDPRRSLETRANKR